MVKERTPQGATNSARKEEAKVPPPKPRAPPPRLLSDEFQPMAAQKKKKDVIGTATWKVDEVGTHDYKTALGHTFNEKEHSLINGLPKAKGYETQRLEMRTFAVDRLRATAKGRYGSVADLFRAVKHATPIYTPLHLSNNYYR